MSWFAVAVTAAFTDQSLEEAPADRAMGDKAEDYVENDTWIF